MPSSDVVSGLTETAISDPRRNVTARGGGGDCVARKQSLPERHGQAIARCAAWRRCILWRGVTVADAMNDVMNSFTPLGDCALLHMANL